MNSIQEKLTDPANPDDLNELVLEAAAVLPDDDISPDVIVRGETIDAGSHRVEVMPKENEETISEQLVDAGNNEAALEQRLASAIDHRTQSSQRA